MPKYEVYLYFEVDAENGSEAEEAVIACVTNPARANFKDSDWQEKEDTTDE